MILPCLHDDIIWYVISIIVVLFIFIASDSNNFVVAQTHDRSQISNDRLMVQKVVSGVSRPTGLAFLGDDDILVLEQYEGTVRRIMGGELYPIPVLDVNVGNSSERGMLGIEVVQREIGNPFVFLYYTEAQFHDGGPILGNRLYRYTFVDDARGGKLVNGTLILDLPGVPDLPGSPGQDHNGGKITLGPDDNIYITVGDVRRKTVTQNLMNGGKVDGSGGILRVTLDGKAVGKGILGSSHPLDKYFAYGIRNSFGIGFDPVTGYLWDTENGPSVYDEINLAEPGFNSGWQSIVGFAGNDLHMWPPSSQEELLTQASIHITSALHNLISLNATAAEEELVVAGGQLEEVLEKSSLLYDFNGRGKYSDPEFAWNQTVAPTAIQFFNSSKYGVNYLNKMFVAEYQTGKLLCFTLNDSRTGLELDGLLQDHIASSWNETDTVAFGRGFDGITDIKIGPDGYLYITERNSGTISKIVPRPNASETIPPSPLSC